MITNSIAAYINIFIIALAVILSLFNLIVYQGRKKKFLIDFCLFEIFIAIIIFNTLITELELFGELYNNSLINIVNTFALNSLIYFFDKVLNYSFNSTKKTKHHKSLLLFLLSLSFTLSFTILFNPGLYHQYIFQSIFVIEVLAIISIFYKYLNYVLKNDLLSKSQYGLVIIISLFFWLDIFLQSGHLAFKIEFPLSGSYLFTGLSLLVALIILISQLNQEYFELNELKQKLELRVEERTKDIQRVNQEKEQSYINLAHQTKTPLTLINNYINEYIEKRGLENEMIVVKKNIDLLNEVIQNYFRETEGQVDSLDDRNIQALNFSEFVNNQLSIFQKHYNLKKVQLKINIDQNLFTHITYNHAEQLINNITESCYKLCPEGCELTISMYESNDKINLIYHLENFVLPESEHKHIFDPLFLSTYFNNTDYTSSGIGLSITKNIIYSLNGSISFQGNSNGSTFYLMLSKAESTIESEVINENISNDYPDSNTQNLSGRLLLVDDSEEMIFYLQQKLHKDYELYTAKNGLDALEQLEHIKRPDLIISDIMMDGMDGISFFKSLSNNSKLNGIPFIFLTAKSSKQEALEGLKTGAVDYIVKPFLFKELKLKIESIIKMHHRFKDNFMKSALNIINEEFYSPVSAEKNNVHNTTTAHYGLTTREIEIIHLIQKGYTNRKIANELHIAESTVARHISNIFEKTAVNNRIDLINKFSQIKNP